VHDEQFVAVPEQVAQGAVQAAQVVALFWYVPEGQDARHWEPESSRPAAQAVQVVADDEQVAHERSQSEHTVEGEAGAKLPAGQVVTHEPV